MTGNELHGLIHSLDRREKSNFAKFTDSSAEFNQGGKRPRYLQLFDRMSRCKVFDEDVIREPLFKSSVKYYQAREKLLDKIIQSLVFYGGEKFSARSYILQALKVDALDLAIKRLISELKSASETQDTDYYHYLLTLRNRIEVSHKMKIELPDDLEDLEAVQFNYQHLLALRNLLRRVTKLIHAGRDYNPDLGTIQLLRELEQIPLSGEESRFLYHKIRCGLNIMELQMEEAFHHQFQAVRELEAMGTDLRNATLAKEYFHLVKLSLSNNDLVTVQRTVFKFSQLKPENKREEEIKNEYWILAAISAGDNHGNLQLVESVLPRLLEASDLFSPDLRALNLFMVARVYFVHESHSQALEVIDNIRSSKKSKWPELNWSIETLRYLIHTELGNVDLLDSLYRSSIRLAEATRGDMAKLSSRLVHRVNYSLEKEEKKETFVEFLDWKKRGIQNSHDMVCLDLFDLTFWFENKIFNTPLLQAYLDQNHHLAEQEKKQQFRKSQ